MKKKHNEGFSLVETLVAITILALIVIPTCSGIIMAFRMNAKADELMQAQLAVSSAVETLMAEGIPNDTETTLDGKDYGKVGDKDRFPGVTVTVEQLEGGNYYEVVVIAGEGESLNEDVSVATYIRGVPLAGGDT